MPDTFFSPPPFPARFLRDRFIHELGLRSNAAPVGGRVAVDLEPFLVELQESSLARICILQRHIRRERDDGVAHRDLWITANLILGGGVADAIGPMFDLFAIPTTDGS